MSKHPSAFVCYSWDNDDHKKWVAGFAARLRSEGVDVALDQWHLSLGDRIHQFMEREVGCNDFVLIVCTPRLKERADNRVGGVGYEFDIMTGDCDTTGNHRKYIPVLRSGDWHTAIPRWLQGKYGVDIRGASYNEGEFQRLVDTLHGQIEEEPPLRDGCTTRKQRTKLSEAQVPSIGMAGPEVARRHWHDSAGTKSFVWKFLWTLGYGIHDRGDYGRDAA